MIYDKQHKKKYMMQLALNHKKIEIEKITQNVDDDENNDNELKKARRSKRFMQHKMTTYKWWCREYNA